MQKNTTIGLSHFGSDNGHVCFLRMVYWQSFRFQFLFSQFFLRFQDDPRWLRACQVVQCAHDMCMQCMQCAQSCAYDWTWAGNLHVESNRVHTSGAIQIVRLHQWNFKFAQVYQKRWSKKVTHISFPSVIPKSGVSIDRLDGSFTQELVLWGASEGKYFSPSRISFVDFNMKVT